MEFHENKAKTPFIRLVQLWHVIHGIAARTADTDYHDNGRIRAGSGQLGHYIVCHIVSFLLS